jgi:RHS repeat-associated protein
MRVIRSLLLAALFPAIAAAQTTTQVVEYYTTDALGSVRAVTRQVNGAWQVVARHDFTPFGEEVSPQIPPQDKRLFTGKERDRETGQDYFEARYLRASTGRFTTVDPAMTFKENLEDPQRWNRYGYVRNNPLRLVDRNGRWIEDVHRDLTTALAYAAGFTWSDAKAIGAADQATDDDPRTQPMDYANASQYHCTNAADRVALWAEAERSGSLEDFGHALHATQDSFIHPPLVLWSAADHAKDRTFDQTHQHPTEALRMAERTFDILVAKAPGAGGPVDFDAIRPMVMAWVAEKDLKKKAKILDDMLSLVDERSVSIKK